MITSHRSQSARGYASHSSAHASNASELLRFDNGSMWANLVQMENIMDGVPTHSAASARIATRAFGQTADGMATEAYHKLCFWIPPLQNTCMDLSLQI